MLVPARDALDISFGHISSLGCAGIRRDVCEGNPTVIYTSETSLQSSQGLLQLPYDQGLSLKITGSVGMCWCAQGLEGLAPRCRKCEYVYRAFVLYKFCITMNTLHIVLPPFHRSCCDLGKILTGLQPMSLSSPCTVSLSLHIQSPV